MYVGIYQEKNGFVGLIQNLSFFFFFLLLFNALEIFLRRSPWTLWQWLEIHSVSVLRETRDSLCYLSTYLAPHVSIAEKCVNCKDPLFGMKKRGFSIIY